MCADVRWPDNPNPFQSAANLGIIRDDLVFEDPRFCFYCGGLLGPSPLTGVPGDYHSHEPRGRCMSCGADWVRLFTHNCPGFGCDPGWVHMSAPAYAEVEHGRVRLAHGLGWCDCCRAPCLYTWRLLESGVPHIQLVTVCALANGNCAYENSGDARGMVSTDS